MAIERIDHYMALAAISDYPAPALSCWPLCRMDHYMGGHCICDGAAAHCRTGAKWQTAVM